MKFTHFNLITELLDSFLVCLTTGSFGVCLINENSIILKKLKKLTFSRSVPIWRVYPDESRLSLTIYELNWSTGKDPFVVLALLR